MNLEVILDSGKSLRNEFSTSEDVLNLEPILNSGLRFSIADGRLSVKGPAALVQEFSAGIKQWKPELLKITAGETVDDVGVCDYCSADLIGLPVQFDGYVNRVCPSCGQWHRCLPPPATKPILVCTSTTIDLFSKVAADHATIGDLVNH